MPLPRFVVCMFPIMLLGAGAAFGQTTSTGSGQAASTGSGQAYPNKPIRIIAAEAGGGSDILARLIAHGSSASLGQNVIVDNRQGSPIIPAQFVSKSPRDGYTLLVHGSAVWILPFLQDNVLYDPVIDFAPVTLAVSSPNVLGVHPSLPVKSVKE